MSLGVSFGQFTENATEAHMRIVDAIAAHDRRRRAQRAWKSTSIAAAD